MEVEVIYISRGQLKEAIEQYIAASRLGDTLSYVETAKLSTAEAAESSTERLWTSLVEGKRGSDGLPVQTVDSSPKEFTCAEDLAAGQVVFVNSRGLIEGKRNADVPSGEPEPPQQEDNDSLFA
jgi:hypothetical protein